MPFLRHLLSISIASLVSSFTAGAPTPASQARGGAQEPPPGPPGAIRVRVRLIPVDVIVTDDHDRPVLDLKKEDFRIFENGRPQEIRHFSIQTLTAISAARRTIQNLDDRRLSPKFLPAHSLVGCYLVKPP